MPAGMPSSMAGLKDALVGRDADVFYFCFTDVNKSTFELV
jgi:hypothetical protein